MSREPGACSGAAVTDCLVPGCSSLPPPGGTSRNPLGDGVELLDLRQIRRPVPGDLHGDDVQHLGTVYVAIEHADLAAFAQATAKLEADRKEQAYPEGQGSSALLMDATLKWPYPPTSLPKKEYMERALQLGEKALAALSACHTSLGLGPLQLKSPWYGYNL